MTQIKIKTLSYSSPIEFEIDLEKYLNDGYKILESGFLIDSRWWAILTKTQISNTPSQKELAIDLLNQLKSIINSKHQNENFLSQIVALLDSWETN
jgi:hypothetical protein